MSSQDKLRKLKEKLVETLNSNNLIKYEKILEEIISQDIFDSINLDSISGDKRFLETIFYDSLINCLELKEFEIFKNLISLSDKLNVYLDIEKIPNRYNVLSRLILNCIEDVSDSYQTDSLGKIIKHIKFFQSYGLIERTLTEKEKKLVENVKKDHLFIFNLMDLFGKLSDSLIYYIRKEIPELLYEFFLQNPNPYFPEPQALVHYIRDVFFNQYIIYGLSVKNLGESEEFIEKFLTLNGMVFYSEDDPKNGEMTKKNNLFIEYGYEHEYITYSMFQMEFRHSEYKKHLISPLNLKLNLKRILDKNTYNFYCISMVLLGGIGPQGHGFTYSTPMGEIVEICSDIKENEAIIIKYKEFLKSQFLKRLKRELIEFDLDLNTIEKIIKHLLEIIKRDEMINISKKEKILTQIRDFLLENPLFDGKYNHDFNELMNKISNAIVIILRPINLKDQFKCRMELIEENKLKSEDIAKLTSLRGKSHHDVLIERFFYQYIVQWFYEVFEKRRAKILSKF